MNSPQFWEGHFLSFSYVLNLRDLSGCTSPFPPAPASSGWHRSGRSSQSWKTHPGCPHFSERSWGISNPTMPMIKMDHYWKRISFTPSRWEFSGATQEKEYPAGSHGWHCSNCSTTKKPDRKKDFQQIHQTPRCFWVSSYHSSQLGRDFRLEIPWIFDGFDHQERALAKLSRIAGQAGSWHGHRGQQRSDGLIRIPFKKIFHGNSAMISPKVVSGSRKNILLPFGGVICCLPPIKGNQKQPLTMFSVFFL